MMNEPCCQYTDADAPATLAEAMDAVMRVLQLKPGKKVCPWVRLSMGIKHPPGDRRVSNIVFCFFQAVDSSSSDPSGKKTKTDE